MVLLTSQSLIRASGIKWPSWVYSLIDCPVVGVVGVMAPPPTHSWLTGTLSVALAEPRKKEKTIDPSNYT
jgi:hypothetical protein